ncbi:uncharacterized protein LOC134210032 [Armigeres subalbatus]|uniref:uncharacterized protein LOC134210032 n=1 Tax=Armigeres subalbatus TaxID=124917 RepID=UPI002ED5D6C8
MADLQQAILQMAELLQKLAQPTPAPSNPEQTIEALATNISEFSFDPENGITFEKWYSRYEDLFDSDARNLDDAAKVRLLLRKLDTPHIPEKFRSANVHIQQTVPVFAASKTEAEDIINYAGKVNRACEDFDFKNMKIDQFKCLMFVCGLKGHGYADIRARLLSRIENEVAGTPVTLQTLIDDYQRLVNLQADTSMIERPSFSKSTVHALQEKNDRGIHRQKQPSKPESKTPRTPCWQCGQMHYVRDCSFANHMCKECKRVGHKEGYCSCFSKQKSVKPEEEKKSSFKSSKSTRKAKSRGVYVVNHIAQHSNKRKYVPTFINGVATKLQLDTASDITVIQKQM